MTKPHDFASWAKAALDPSGTELTWPDADLRNVVVTVATGYPAHLLRPLVRSLRKVSDAPLVIVAHDDSDVAEEFAGQGVILYPVAKDAGYRPYPALARLEFYLDIVAGLPKQTERLLLVDSRDVTFQSDPFDGLHDVPLEFFGENNDTNSWTLGTTNGRWAWLMLETAQRECLLGKPIVNGGVIAGTPDGIAAMCRTKLELAMGTHEWTKHTTGLDNISTNVVAHAGQVPGAVVSANHTQVANIYRDTQMKVSPDGALISPGGKVCPIVHMYDRRAELKQLVHALYEVNEDPKMGVNQDRSVGPRKAFADLRHYAKLVRIRLTGS